MGNITFKQYRNIDLFILSVLLILSEGLTTLATTRWFVGVPFAISTTLIFICIGLMRWGWHAAILAAVGGATLALASGAGWQQLIVYTFGNIFALSAMLMIRALGKDKIRSSVWLLILLASTVYLSAAVGRWLVSLIFELSISSLLVFITTDIVTLLFTAVLLVLMRRVDGMIEDQHDYLLRLEREREIEAVGDGDELVNTDHIGIDGAGESYPPEPDPDAYDDGGDYADKPDYED